MSKHLSKEVRLRLAALKGQSVEADHGSPNSGSGSHLEVQTTRAGKGSTGKPEAPRIVYSTRHGGG